MKTKRAIIAVALILIMATAISVSGCGLGGDPKSVVNVFFDSIDKHDAKLFLKCFDDEFTEIYEEFVEDDYLEEMLEELDDMLADEYGKNWRKMVKIGKAKKTDTDDGVTYYDVEVEFDDEEETITVKQVKGKYYLDESAMGSMF